MLLNLGFRVFCISNAFRSVSHPHILCLSSYSSFKQHWYLRWSSNHHRLNSRRYAIRKAIYDKRDKLNQARQRLHRKGKLLLEDLEETRQQMRKRMEKIVERENIYTIPNILCAARILVTPYLGYLILQMDFNTAFCVMAFAGITDLLDGLIARNIENQSSKLGSFLDPMADKILISTMFLTLTYVDLIPVLLTFIIVSRDVTLAGAGFYIRYKSLPPPRTISRYFDITHATAQLAPTFISKINTLVQLCTAAATLSGPVLHFVDHQYFCYLWWITGVTTVVSGISYIYSKNTYTLLKKSKM